METSLNFQAYSDHIVLWLLPRCFVTYLLGIILKFLSFSLLSSLLRMTACSNNSTWLANLCHFFRTLLKALIFFINGSMIIYFVYSLNQIFISTPRYVHFHNSFNNWPPYTVYRFFIILWTIGKTLDLALFSYASPLQDWSNLPKFSIFSPFFSLSLIATKTTINWFITFSTSLISFDRPWTFHSPYIDIAKNNEWVEDNGSNFNIPNWKIIIYGVKRYQIQICHHLLEQSNKIKYLGTSLDSSPSFQQQRWNIQAEETCCLHFFGTHLYGNSN